MFYETYFGFSVVEEIDGEWAVLMAGQVELALHLAGRQFRKSLPGPASSNAQAVFTVDSSLPELRIKLQQAGVELGEIKRHPRFAYSLCDRRDPEGNVFQLCQFD